MGTKEANDLLRSRLEEHPEGLPYGEMVDAVKERCGVADTTARTYISRSEYAQVENDGAGDKVVVSSTATSDDITYEDTDKVPEMEVGDRTGKMFGELGVLQNNGHPLLEKLKPHKTGYIRRRMGSSGSDLSRKTDVQVVTAAMSIPDYAVMLIGKHGVGKDQLVYHICAKTNRPVLRLVGTDDPDFVDLLFGSYAPNEDGDFEHQKGLLQIAVRNGYTFILDEFNNLNEKLQTQLNLMLEESDKGQMVIPETNEVITPHPEFQFVGTMNPNTIGYGGREDLDQATGSRFIPIELPPLEEQGERKVVSANTHWDENDRDLDKLLGENGGVIPGIRSLHDMGKISTWPSTRDVIQIGNMAEKLGSAQAAAELVLCGRAEGDDKDPIQDNILDQNW